MVDGWLRTRVCINGEDAGGTSLLGSLDDGKTDSSKSKNGDTAAWGDFGIVEHSAEPSTDTTTKEADLVEVGLRVNLGA